MVLELSKQLGITEFVEKLPNGFETQIGENGAMLSGGQKQRLALARIFLRHPAVMMLDDVMSAVDQITERKLIENLYEQKSSLILSSHRLSALRSCDTVLLLKNGEVIDQGKADELICHFGGHMV